MWAETTTRLAALAALLPLSGCSTVYEGKFDFSEGWRKGTVVRLLRGDAIENPRLWTCTRKVPEGLLASTDYVLVSYLEMSRKRTHLVPAPSGLPLAPDEQVYVDVDSCEQAIAKRQ